MRNGATTWRDHDRARNVSESRISQASEADLSGPLPMSALGQKADLDRMSASGAERPLGKYGVTVSGGPRRHRDTGRRSGLPDCAKIHPSTCHCAATFARLAGPATRYWLGAGRQRELRPSLVQT